MSTQYVTQNPQGPTGEEESQQWAQELEAFAAPYLERLDAYLDRRMVGSLLGAIKSIISQRGKITLTEVGAGLTGPEHASAGVKRLDRALHHEGWNASLIQEVMWEEAAKVVEEMQARGEKPIFIMDGSELEKPESQQIVGNSVVRSAKARRLARYRKQVYNAITIPIRVPGYEWEALILVREDGLPLLVAMRWWKRAKGESGQMRSHQLDLLEEARFRFGSAGMYVYDRGYGHGPWITVQRQMGLQYVVRWKSGNKLVDAQGRERKAWEIARGNKGWSEPRNVWDRMRRCLSQGRVQAFRVSHGSFSFPLWLVVMRFGKGREPWYLLTNEPITSVDDAWRMISTYTIRWKIEECFRVEKGELQIETWRVQDWETQQRLLWLVTLACGALLAFLSPSLLKQRSHLLKHWCQRSDWRMAQAKFPVYRLRWALSALWTRYPPSFSCCLPYRPPTRITWPFASWKWWMTCWNQLDLPLSYRN